MLLFFALSTVSSFHFHFKVSSVFLSCRRVNVCVLVKAQAQLKVIVAMVCARCEFYGMGYKKP